MVVISMMVMCKDIVRYLPLHSMMEEDQGWLPNALVVMVALNI